MKYLITILLFFCFFNLKAQVKVGADGAMHATGNYPVAIQRELKGHALSVESITERDAIPANFRDTGMLIYTRSDSSLYTLVGGITNADWLKLSSGGITVSVDSVFITSIDSIFITNTDSIFIVSGNDTIFIGTDNAGMDTAYTRNDSIFGYKNNTEFLISDIHQLIDSIFITNTDSIFIISGNDTIYIGNNGSGGDSIVSFEKNVTQDSIILLLRDGRRLAVIDNSGGGGSSSITLDSFYVDFDTTLGYQVTVPISAATAKNIDISSASESGAGFQIGWSATQAVLTYQAGKKGIYKYYITYYQGLDFWFIISLIPMMISKRKRDRHFNIRT